VPFEVSIDFENR